MKSSNRSRLLRASLPGMLALALTAGQVTAQDRVEVNTGNNVTGEVEGLRQGKLHFDADGLGDVSIEVADILFLEAPGQFEIITIDGDRLVGSLGRGSEPGTVVVNGTEHFLREIGELRPVELTFWARTGGYADLGFTAARANEAVTLSLGAEARYSGLDWSGVLSGSQYYQSQKDADQTLRSNVLLQVARRLGGVWSVGGLTQFESNDELSLDSRFQAGLGGGLPVTRSHWVELTLSAWILGNNELYFDQTDATNSLEAGLQANFDAFKYDSPELSHSTTLSVYPSLTESGRYRLAFNSRTSYEVLNDFFLGLTFKDNYDSAPPSDIAGKNDWTVSFSVGWSW